MKFAKLRGRIREMFGTQASFAKSMGMNPSTLSAKLNGSPDWTLLEIKKAVSLLDIHVAEIAVYFEVDKNF